MLTVLATATSDLLASVADTKEAMDLTDAVNDEKLKRFIRRASAQIEQFCNRPLLAQTYRAMLPSYGGPRLQLPHYPIRKVLAVYEGSDTGAAVLVSTSDYTVNDQLGQLERADGWGWSAQVDNDISIGPVSDSEVNRWLVEWSAGYVPLDGKTSTVDGTTATGSTLPYALQDAAISLTRSRWLSRTRDSSVSSKSVGELSVSYRAESPNGSSLPADVLELLAPYRSLT